jgi:hypothetical protein
MSFNWQPNIFFGKIISYTCDLHLKLNFLNPLNIYFYQMAKKMSLLTCNPPFKISKIWIFYVIWFFIKFIQWTYIFIERGMILLYKKFEINCMILRIPFDSLKKKQFKHFI